MLPSPDLIKVVGDLRLSLYGTFHDGAITKVHLSGLLPLRKFFATYFYLSYNEHITIFISKYQTQRNPLARLHKLHKDGTSPRRLPLWT